MMARQKASLYTFFFLSPGRHAFLLSPFYISLVFPSHPLTVALACHWALQKKPSDVFRKKKPTGIEKIQRERERENPVEEEEEDLALLRRISPYTRCCRENSSERDESLMDGSCPFPFLFRHVCKVRDDNGEASSPLILVSCAWSSSDNKRQHFIQADPNGADGARSIYKYFAPKKG